MRLAAQWPMFPHARMEARYSRQLRWDTAEPVSALMLGTRFDLPRRFSFATSLETDGEHGHKAWVNVTVLLELR